MKKQFIFKSILLLLLCSIYLISCKKFDKEIIGDYESDLAKIKLLGLDTKGIIDYGDYYLVEGDIGLRKESLKSIPRQVNFNFFPIVHLSHQNNITVKIANEVPSDGTKFDYHAAISMALQEWNSLEGSNIKFTLVNTLEADITIYAKFLYEIDGITPNTNLAAQMDYFPINGNPGSSITINTNYALGDNYSDTDRKWIIAHELGHCIGIAHTQDFLTSYTSKIGNSPNYDEHSLFNGGMAGLYSGFTLWDKYAINYLYPNPSATIYYNVEKNNTFKKDNCGLGYVGSSFTYSVAAGKYRSTISQENADLLAQMEINEHDGQNYINNYGTCTYSGTVNVIVTNYNPWMGYKPYISFVDPTTNQIISNIASNSGYGYYSLPLSGVYNLVILQTNNKPLTVSISGYPTKTGQTIYYNNVSIQGSFPMIIINNTSN